MERIGECNAKLLYKTGRRSIKNCQNTGKEDGQQVCGNRTFACGIEESISRSGGTGFGTERIERGRFTQSCQ